jgi:hypothetical protein
VELITAGVALAGSRFSRVVVWNGESTSVEFFLKCRWGACRLAPTGNCSTIVRQTIHMVLFTGQMEGPFAASRTGDTVAICGAEKVSASA